MTNNDPSATYTTSQFKRIQFVVIAFVVLFVVSVFSVIVAGRAILPMPGIIGISLLCYFTGTQTIRLYPDRVTQKGLFGKAIECSYKDGTFSLEQATTFEALFIALKPKKLIIRYTHNGNQKRLALGGTLSDQDIHEIYRKIQEKQ